MTLCTAWIRQASDFEELIFATDSCLSSGERWHSGVKLFELPRKDCLLCFAGDTNRTYTLILNLISSIKFDSHLSNPHTDIIDVLDYLTDLFSNLCNSITNYEPQSFKEALGDFQFMFGGWSWKKSKFRVWKLIYNHELKAFIHIEFNEDNMYFGFIGDEIDKAESLLTEELSKNKKVLSRNFDMEPMKVLLRMIRDKEFDSIDGAIQMAKIYPPGITEFFGVMWPSYLGRKTFLGKDVNFEHKPSVKYLDPDTCEIMGEDVPVKIIEPLEEIYGVNFNFIKDCYSEENFQLKGNISERHKMTLKIIFKEVAYKEFLKLQNEEELENDQIAEM